VRLAGSEYFERVGQDGPKIDVRRVPEAELAGYETDGFRGQNDDSGFPPPLSTPPHSPPRKQGPKPPQANHIEHQPHQWVKPPEREPVFFRAQNFGGPPFQTPQSPLFDNSPQGDPLDRAIRGDEGLLDATIFATEARTGRLMFGVGVNSDAGVVGQFVLSEMNFDLYRPPTSFQDIIDGTAWRGGGQRFRLEAVPGNVVSRYLVNWSDPYFLDTDFSLSVSGFYYNRFLPDWDERRGGGRVSLGRQLTPEFSVSGQIRLEEVRLTDPDVPTPQLLLDGLGSHFLSTARISAAHDTRDSAFLPGAGHLIEVGYEQAFGDFDFPRAEGEARQYFTLYSRPDGGGRHIVMLRGQVGWTGEDTPIFERFFAGGFQTFRGFEFRGVGPIGPGTDVRIGGRWMTLGTAEYMFPLTASEAVQGVVFSDFGTVENDVGLDEFRVTVGGGLRITVPAMGPVPLAFDWAVPILEEDGDDTQFFSFYVGVNR
ncbi:MAG: BamA/TamA family outer membrane protein, partial [Planctomycetes bacterium]|nr:BamA/TamA family outer membrane protein [Planctomycetota bacterium]